MTKNNRNWLVLLLLVGGAISLSIVSLISYQIVRQLILEEIRAKALLKVERTIDNLDDWLQDLKTSMNTMTNTPMVQSLDWDVIQKYLQAEVARDPRYLGISFAGLSGDLYNQRLGYTKKNIKDRDYYQKAMKGEANVNDPFIGRASQLPIIAVAVPIKPQGEKNSSPVGILSGLVTVEKLNELVSSLSYGKNSYGFAVNSKGEAIFHPDPRWQAKPGDKLSPSLLDSQDANLAAIVRAMVNREQGIKLTQINGEWKYIAYNSLKNANWSVGLVIPRANIESPLIALNLLATMLGILLIIALIGIWRQIELFNQTQDQVELLQIKSNELSDALTALKQTQTHLIQTEKMSGLGQMVAGIAHEINNPVNFIHGNIRHINDYMDSLFDLLNSYQEIPNIPESIREIEEDIDIDFIAEDLPKIIKSMLVGTTRIKEIVLSLRNFSRLDEADKKDVDIHEGIESTLLLIKHLIKDQITIIKNYGDLPLIECYPSKLNQVFMNLLNNACDALYEFNPGEKKIIITTELIKQNDQEIVRLAIEDNGPGIPPEIQTKIFDPFFTTKAIGKGTGLGLAISYQIVVEVHKGKIYVDSSPELGGARLNLHLPN